MGNSGWGSITEGLEARQTARVLREADGRLRL